jgi:ATP-binding cassette subfamily B (MDR/TAP) protein 1
LNPHKLVLRPSNFVFPAGEITFLVGRSGSGKSTIGNLLVRFYDPRTGDIRLDGRPLDSLDLHWLRSNITLIQQSSILFRDSIFNNVALGAGDPSYVSNESVQEACATALLQSTIATLPDGLDTIVGMGGHGLSGGQRQRLALARAKLRNPPVLILDEVTSGLDPVTRSLIMDAIRMWRRGKTTIIITHEVAQIGDDDYVYVLEDSILIQEGRRRDLAAAKNGLFASFLATADTKTSSRSSSESPLETSQEKDNRDVSRERMSTSSNIRSSQIFFAFDFGRLSLGPFPIELKLDKERVAGNKQVEDYSIAQQTDITGRAKVQDLRLQLSDSEVSDDSRGLFVRDHVAQTPRHTKKQKRRTPGLLTILSTVWPSIDNRGRVCLILGLLNSLIVAASTPAFSVLFAKLLEAFWTTEDHLDEGARWATFLALVGIIGGTGTFFAYLLMETVGDKWINALRGEALSRILGQPKTWSDKAKHSPGRISECLDRDAEEMKKLVGQFVPITIIAIGMVGTALGWALAIRWDLTLVALAGCPAVVLVARANSTVSDRWEAKCDVAAGKTSAIFAETFTNIHVVRALTLERYFTRRHSRSADSTYGLGLRRAAYSGFFFGLYQSIAYFITALTFYYGTRLLRDGTMDVTDVLKVINLLLFSTGNSILLLGNIPQMATAKATAAQMLYYAHLPTESYDAAGGHSHLKLITPLPVRFNKLNFAYPSRPHTQVLRNISLRIDRGTCTAIVGASGCGKSTLAALLLRLYDPLPGYTIMPALTYASVSADRLSTSHLLAHTAYVPQHAFLFPASLRDNVLYGLPEAGYSAAEKDALLRLAATRAGISDLAASLPNGWHTEVGEGGIALSGGQAQRVCIARALARRPKLLVLDEPTSALDAEAAEGIRGVIASLVSTEKGMAVVVITHSKEMMKVAHRVVLLDRGSVAEEGTFDQLLRRNGHFAALVHGEALGRA